MELADVARIIRQYRWLIALCYAIGIGIVGLIHYGELKTYTASTRLVLDTPDPESRAQSGVIADTAKAIATSPPQVGEALTRAGVRGRDPDDVARGRVSVRALGSSGIIQISVRDHDPQAAAMIANALAAEVIETRLGVTTGQQQQVLRDLDRRITKANRRISALDARISSLAIAAEAAGDAAAANAIRSRGDDAERRREFLAQQRSVMEAERVNVLSSEALRLKPSIISRASSPARADSSPVVPDMVLGALIGLIIGIGLAGVIELVRPTVRGGRALARAFDTPLLGILSGRQKDGEDVGATPIGVRLAFAADAAGVTSFSLFAVGRPVDMEAIARHLPAGWAAAVDFEEEPRLARTAEGQGAQTTWTANVGRVGRSVRAAAVDPSGAPALPVREGRAGVVIVTPLTLSKGEIDEAVSLVRGTSLPLLGLIATDWLPQSSRTRRSSAETLNRVRSAS